MSMFQAFKNRKSVSDAVVNTVVAALKTAGAPTVASAIFGKHPEFKGPETVPPITGQGKGPQASVIGLKEAEASGMMKRAKPCGWGIYQVDDLDGGLGSIWYLAEENGEKFLVKQVDAAGDVVRRMKEAPKA